MAGFECVGARRRRGLGGGSISLAAGSAILGIVRWFKVRHVIHYVNGSASPVTSVFAHTTDEHLAIASVRNFCENHNDGCPISTVAIKKVSDLGSPLAESSVSGIGVVVYDDEGLWFNGPAPSRGWAEVICGFMSGMITDDLGRGDLLYLCSSLDLCEAESVHEEVTWARCFEFNGFSDKVVQRIAQWKSAGADVQTPVIDPGD